MRMTQTQEVIRLSRQDNERASEVLARAFYNDPMLQCLVPNDVKRIRLLLSFFGLVVRYCLHYGEVYTTPALEGAACWLSPGNTTPTFVRILRTGVYVSPLDFGLGGLLRDLQISAYMDAAHARAAPGRHWYLWALGVDPPYQGQGIGGMLIQPVLVRADAEGLPCYLETENPRNVPFYQKHGFTVVSEGEVTRRRLHVWGMLRESHR
jgi:ribosomal protein S18 acetylase RimI-like enzyme